jgi:hypothetical protein
MVALIVGPTQRHRFEIHKQLLIDESRRFRLLFGGSRFDAQPGMITYSLPEIDPIIFHKLYEWLYVGNTQPIAQSLVIFRLNSEETGIQSMLKLYLAAYALEFIELENLAMDLLGNGYYVSDMYPSNEDIELAYNKTGPGSGLRRYMARAFSQKLLTSIAGPPLNELRGILTRQPSLATDIVLQSLGTLTNGLRRTEDLTTCEFHSHYRGDPCPTSRISFNTIDYVYATGSI